jgi:hypothetical protein
VAAFAVVFRAAVLRVCALCVAAGDLAFVVVFFFSTVVGTAFTTASVLGEVFFWVAIWMSPILYNTCDGVLTNTLRFISNNVELPGQGAKSVSGGNMLACFCSFHYL